ncbi:MAG: response regulator [Myxococcales bacterium]|nr:response regulator [Myxococcales bacterium]
MSEESATALEGARDHFISGLPNSSAELRDLLAAVRSAPPDSRARAALRTRLHGLYASAQIIEDADLSARFARALAEVDAGADDTLDEVTWSGLLDLADFLESQAPSPERISAAPRRGAPRPHFEAPTQPLPDRADRAGVIGERQVLIPNTVAGTLSAPEVLAVLLVGAPERVAAIRSHLDAGRYLVTQSDAFETAAAVLDNVAPDAVLIAADLLDHDAASRVRALRGPAGNRPVLALGGGEASEAVRLHGVGVDAMLALDATAHAVDRQLRLLLPSDSGAESALGQLEAGTVDEIAAAIGEEVRRGIAESLQSGRGERLDLGDKSELLAATWSAIGRIRSHLSQRSGGRVHFEPVLHHGGPLPLALTFDDESDLESPGGEFLAGRRIVVADDDPAVVWFFAGLLREAGALVQEVADGKQALELCRRRRPDVVISDILMPEIDGFTLCRELERDLQLSRVPVVLLSWKEDFLQRMRELDSRAAGYLRKEAGSAQILRALAQVLRPRMRLEALLQSGDEVSGRIDRIGPRVLLETVAALRPNAQLEVQDAWSHFAVEIVDGERLSVQRLAPAAARHDGPRALRELMGVELGRFTVSAATGPARGALLADSLEQALARAEAELGAMLDAVSGPRLFHVRRVELDEATLDALLLATPTSLAELATILRESGGALAEGALTDIELGGDFAFAELEGHMRELVRRGCVIRVLGEAGDDRAQEAALDRIEQPGALMHAPERARPGALPAAALDERDADWLDQALPPEEAEPRPSPPVAAPAVAFAPSTTRTGTQPPPIPSDARKPPPEATIQVAPEAFVARSALLDSTTRMRAAPASDDRSPWTVFLIVALLSLVGFVGLRLWLDEMARREAAAAGPAQPASQPPATASGDQDLGGAGAAQEVEPLPPSPSFGRVLPFIDRSYGVAVGPDQGLLVVEYDEAGTAPEVRLDKQPVGQLPVRLAVDAGRHELVIERDGRVGFRFLLLHAGETRIVEVK